MSDHAKAVFLSYASQDAEAARRICDALRAAGVEVWFDADGGLEHGDEWDAKIRRQIKECVLFIPIISASTQAREEGYFRIEWELAAQRALGIASGVPFILPVVIDETREPDALVPDRFRTVQWTRLRNGEVPPEVLQRFLKLWSHRTGVLKHEATQGGAVGASPAAAAQREAPASHRRPWAMAAGAGVALVAAAMWWWQPWRPASPARAALAASAANPPAPSTASPTTRTFPRDPELKRAWDLFLNATNATAEDFALAEDIVKGVVARRPADPEAVIVYAWLNDAYLNRGFDLSEERFMLGRRYAERAVQLAPDEPEALAALGQFLSFRRADLTRAEQLLRRAIELNPHEPRFYRALAYNVVRFARPEEALPIAEHAAELFPHDPLVFYELALHYRDAGRIDDMERTFDRTLALAPIGAAMIWKSWIAGWVHGDLAGMKQWLDRIPPGVRLTDRALIVRYEYACLTRRPAELDEALRGLQAFPGAELRDFYYTGPKALLIGDLFSLQGKRELAKGQFDLALPEVAQAKAAAPADFDALMNECWTLLSLERRAEALADLRQAISSLPPDFRPRFVNWWFSVTPAALLLGDRALALKRIEPFVDNDAMRDQFRVALRLDPRMAPFRDDPEINALLAERKKTTVVPAPLDKSIAVLAFADQSPAHDSEYFSDGISEELLNVLAKVPGLKVTARTSSFHFKGKDTPIPEIAQQLGVAYVVEGSVQRAGDNVRITAELIKAADGFHVWSEHFDRELKNVFALQDEIAGLIAKQLQLSLGDAPHLAKVVNPEAHQHLLEGRYFWLLRTDDGFARAERAYAQALQIDPGFGEAHAGMANVCAIRGWYSYLAGGSPNVDFARARDEAQVALRLDPSLAEAYAALGAVAYNEWKFSEAEQAFQTALRLNPNYSFAHHWRAHLLMSQGRIQESVDELERATQLDPLQFITLLISATHLSYAGRYADALVRNERALALRPDVFIPAYGNEAVYLLALGRNDEAVAAARVVTREITIQPRWWEDANAIYVLRVTGHAPEAIAHGEKILASLPKDSSVRADVLAALGRTDEAIEQLGRARPRPSELSAIFCGDAWAAVRQHPRFPEILAQYGITESYRATQEERKRLGIGTTAKR